MKGITVAVPISACRIATTTLAVVQLDSISILMGNLCLCITDYYLFSIITEIIFKKWMFTKVIFLVD